MKINDLAPFLASFQKMAIYEAVGEDFPDLYSGKADKISLELLNRDIACIGVYEGGTLEIQARRV